MQAWGKMEAQIGNELAARSVFRQGLGACPKDAPLYLEAALLESRAGNARSARNLFQKGAACSGRPHVPLLTAWQLLEQEQGNLEEVQRLQGELERARGDEARRYGREEAPVPLWPEDVPQEESMVASQVDS